jgi:DNA invertase Pin-like site-specific DNA recombinase
MDDELLSPRLDRLEREIILLRQTLNEIKGMIASLSSGLDGQVRDIGASPLSNQGKTIGEIHRWSTEGLN